MPWLLESPGDQQPCCCWWRTIVIPLISTRKYISVINVISVWRNDTECKYIYIYICVCVCLCVCVYLCVYTYEVLWYLASHSQLSNVVRFAKHKNEHYNDVIMSTMESQITSLTIVYSNVYSDADHRKHQSSASLAFVRGIHRWPVNSPHKWPVTRRMFPFDDVIMVDVGYREPGTNMTP